MLKVASLATTVVVNAGEASDVAAPDQNQDTPSISSSDMKTLPMLDNDVVATLSALLDAGAAGEGGATLMVDGVEMKNVGVSTAAIERVSINQDPYSAQYRQPGDAAGRGGHEEHGGPLPRRGNVLLPRLRIERDELLCEGEAAGPEARL